MSCKKNILCGLNNLFLPKTIKTFLQQDFIIKFFWGKFSCILPYFLNKIAKKIITLIKVSVSICSFLNVFSKNIKESIMALFSATRSKTLKFLCFNLVYFYCLEKLSGVLIKLSIFDSFRTNLSFCSMKFCNFSVSSSINLILVFIWFFFQKMEK